MTKTLIILIAAASIAFASAAKALTNEEYDRYVRQVEHDRRMKELNNSILKMRCLNLQLSIQNAGGPHTQQGITIRSMMNDEINECHRAGFWR